MVYYKHVNIYVEIMTLSLINIVLFMVVQLHIIDKKNSYSNFSKSLNKMIEKFLT